MKNIKIGVKLPSSKEINAQLDKLLKKGYDINLNSDNFKNVINEITNNTEKLKTELNGIGKGSFDNVTKSAEKSMAVFTELAETMGKLNEKSQARVKNNSNTAELKQAQAINQALDEQYRKQQSLNNLKEQLSNKISIASKNGFVDTTVIDNLQNKLNSINSNSAEKEINELKTAINNLSSSDSGIVRLQNAITRLQERISNIKKNKIDIIDTSEISELKLAETEVANLKNMLTQLKTGDVIDGKKISSSINSATSSVRTLENEFRNVNTTASGLSTTMKSIFSYAIGGSGIYLVMNSMRDAFNKTLELNTAMRDLRRVTEETEATYSNFMKTANETAVALGTTTSGAIEATTTFSQLGYTFEQASEYMSQMALILSNVGDMSASDAASSLVSILKGFRLEAEETTKVVDILNESGNRFALTTGDLTEGLRIGGASLATANNDLEEASALIIAGTEVLRNSNLVANGLKTISMRMRGVSEDGEELNASMGEFIKTMTGVDLTDANNEFRSTYDILKDIGEVWDDLNSMEQAMLAEEIAGKNRANVFTSIMQNASQLENAYDTLKESAGSATKEQEAYMDSLEGKINALKESFTAITMQMMNSDFLKGFIDGMTTGVNAVSGFIDTFGAIPTTVGVATASLVAFNSKIRENANMMLQAIPGYGKLTTAINGYSDKLKLNIDSIKSQIEILKVQQANSLKAGESTTALGRQMLGLNTNLALTTATMVAMNVVSIALSATLSAIGGMLIGAIISGISKLADSIIVTKDELNDMKQSFSDAFSETSELDSLVQRQRELKDQLEDTTLSADEQKTKKEELIDVQRQLAELLPDTATGFDEEGNKISEDTGLIQENIEKKKELLAMESVKIAKETNNGEWNKLLNNYNKQIDKVKELQEIYNNAPTPVNLENLTEAEDKLDSYKEQLKQLSDMISSWKDVGFGDEDISEMLLGDIYDDSRKEQEIQAEKFAKLKSLVNEYTASIQENTKAKEENNNVDTGSDTSEAQSAVNSLQATYEKLGYTVKEAKDRIEELNSLSAEDKSSEIVKDATTAYGEAISKTKELDSLLKEINEEQSMTPELIMELAEKYPELGSRITDVASVQEFLNNKIQEQTKAQVEAYQIMVQNDQSYYNSKILNNEELNKNFQALCASFVDDQGNAYSVDLKNYTSLAQLKQKLTNDLGEGVADFITNFVTANAQGYNVDLNNTASWASSKAKIIQQLNAQIKKLESNMASALSKIQSDAYTGMKAGDLEAEKLYTMASNQLKTAQAKYEEIQTEFSTYNKGFSSYTPSFSSGSFNTGSGSGNKGSSGSSSSSKEVEDIEVETDRYYDLNNAIEKVNDALEINDILSKNANDDAKLKYIKEEISLYNQKRQALEKLQAEKKKELSEFKNSLSKNGFTFDADGNISNLNSRLKSLESWANGASGTEKENRQTTVKNIQSMIDSYKDLRDKVSDINADILDINNSIIDAQKDIADIIKDQYEEWKDLEEKKTDKLKEEIQKRKEMMQKEWETEDYQDELDEEQNKLNELMSQRQDAIRTGNENLISQLDKEIEEQRKTINDLIRDQERDDASDKYDEMMDTLDKELEAKLEAMDEKVTDDALLQAVQSGATSLEDIFSNIDLASRSVNKNILMVSDGITDWNTKLNDFVSTLNSISASAITLDLSGSLQGVTTLAGSSNPINISTVINLEGGTVISEADFEEALSNNNKYIFKEINNIFKR